MSLPTGNHSSYSASGRSVARSSQEGETQLSSSEQLSKSELAALEIVRRLGDEQFREGDRDLGFDLLDFWQWCSSDLTNNVMRGIVAEYLVARALGVAAGTRIEWDPYDLVTSRGVKVEVKSAAYVQSWEQAKYSDISFSVAPTSAWDYTADTRESARKRQADVYVFALLHHKHKPTLNPLDLEHWTFYILSTATLDKEVGPTQGSITLSRLRSFGPREARFADLAQTLAAVVLEHDEGEAG